MIAIRRVRAVFTMAAAALLATGCRNPFSPNAVVTIESITALGGNTAGTSIFSVQASQALSLYQNNAGFHLVTIALRNYSSVDVLFTSYSVVYRDLYLNAPVATLGGAAGLRFPMTYTLGPFNDNRSSLSWFPDTVTIMAITPAFADYIQNGDLNMRLGGGADLEITLYGQDANGYDVRVTGTLHVELY